MLFLEQKIRAALTPRGFRILPLSELTERVFGTTPTDEQLDELRRELETLERRGELVRVRGEKYSLIEYTNYQAGTIAIRGERRGYLLSGERGVPDIPINKDGLGPALDGDVVLVRLEKTRRRSAPRGRDQDAPFTGTVEKVLTRRRENVVGKIRRLDEGVFLKPFDSRIDAEIRIPGGRDLEAPDGIYVEARFLSFPDARRNAKAEVLEIIGYEGDAGVDVEVVARKWGIPRQFPEEVIRESEVASGLIPADELQRRQDFRDHVIVTIDGETARDFDDAIEADALPDGGFRIGIHIADVSHYVREGTPLDAEAFERATSVYFPDRAIPMLPERLSNDLCSLRPDEDRRTVSAILTLNKQGETVKAEFCRSVIRSRARLTYTIVGELLCPPSAEKPGPSSFPPPLAGEGEGGGAPVVPPIPPDVIPMLRTAFSAAKLLRTMRSDRGALDFDLPDADLILGETGDVVAIVREVRNEAHRLIEEFMLAANEAVAKHLEFLPAPALYRVHDAPDDRKIAELRSVLEPLGYEIEETEDGVVDPQVFQSLLDAVEGKPEERFVCDLVLKAQKKALYAEECRGHYALAAPYYCHFTSPIRRYPDLVVHRALTHWLADPRPLLAGLVESETRKLARWSQHCSERERRSEGAEREAAAWKKFVFLADRVGQEFSAYISSVAPFGLFVILQDYYVDGLIPVATMSDDFYRYDEAEHQLTGTSAGRVFRLGDAVKVRLVKADHDRRTLEFVLTELIPNTTRKSRPDVSRRPGRPARRGRKPWKR
jgi:ribonuclease R